jgi:hypothetical protein
MEVGFRFLQADEIGLLLREPLEETLAGRGTNPAAIHCSDAHIRPHSKLIGKKSLRAFFGRWLRCRRQKASFLPPAITRSYARAR